LPKSSIAKKSFQIQYINFVAHELLFYIGNWLTIRPSVFGEPGSQCAALFTDCAMVTPNPKSIPGQPPAPGNEPIRRAHYFLPGQVPVTKPKLPASPTSLFHPFVTAGAGLI
jgi:hypothetical protein